MSEFPARDIETVDDEAHFIARVAWHYYVEGINQQAVADRLATNRLRVNQALRDARLAEEPKVERIAEPEADLADMLARRRARYHELRDFVVR